MKDDLIKLQESFNLINGKWKILVLWVIFENSPCRYSILKKELSAISHKILSQQLKDLEDNDLIVRKQYPEVPPRVEYSLSKKGQEIMVVLKELQKFSIKY